MTENKFLNIVSIEGLLMLCLGLGMLILPKISMISFGLTICLSFIAYGGYKIINAILTRNFSRQYILDIIDGLILAISGILLFVAPVFDISFIMGLVGIYFILKSLSSFAFTVQTRKTLNFWWLCFFLSIMELFFGFLIIVILPSAALWLVGILAGIDFILSGIIYLNMYISTKYIQGL